MTPGGEGRWGGGAGNGPPTGGWILLFPDGGSSSTFGGDSYLRQPAIPSFVLSWRLWTILREGVPRWGIDCPASAICTLGTLPIILCVGARVAQEFPECSPRLTPNPSEKVSQAPKGIPLRLCLNNSPPPWLKNREGADKIIQMITDGIPEFPQGPRGIIAHPNAIANRLDSGSGTMDSA